MRGINATGQDNKSADDSGQTEVRQEETDAAEESDISDTEEFRRQRFAG